MERNAGQVLLALARIDGYDLVGKACPLDEQSNHGGIGSGWKLKRITTFSFRVLSEPFSG
jgi:hypothetical protein